jgi:hypothetical protein
MRCCETWKSSKFGFRCRPVRREHGLARAGQLQSPTKATSQEHAHSYPAGRFGGVANGRRRSEVCLEVKLHFQDLGVCM